MGLPWKSFLFTLCALALLLGGLACTRPLPPHLAKAPREAGASGVPLALGSPEDTNSLPASSLDRGEPISSNTRSEEGVTADVETFATVSQDVSSNGAGSARAQMPSPAPGLAPPASVEGWRISIPSIGVDAPIVPVGLDPDGSMGAPESPHVVGWYHFSPQPGRPGNVLLDGHVDWTDRQTGVPFGAVFWNLTKLAPGSQVTITDGNREQVYTVSEKLRFRWDDPAGASVLQPTSDARITMITCGGVFDRATRNYSLRDVVIAHLAN